MCEYLSLFGQQDAASAGEPYQSEKPELEEDAVKFEFYAILLIEDCPDGCCCCGRKHYDYSVATMLFLTPGEIFRMSKGGHVAPKGLAPGIPSRLAVPAPRSRTTSRIILSFLITRKRRYTSPRRETSTVTCLLEHIEEELHHPIDAHTGTILSRHIELLLDYCTRFYERQFITRENKTSFLLARLDRMFDEYLDSGRLSAGGLPVLAQCAAALNLSAAYFSDLLKFETGKSLEEYFEFRRLDTARRLLSEGMHTPAAVARCWGIRTYNVSV